MSPAWFFFAVGFGLLMFWEVTRYFYFGWVEELYPKSQFHFQYEWFSWIEPFPGNGMYLLFAALGILALMIMRSVCFTGLRAILFFPRIQLCFPDRPGLLQQSFLPDLPAKLHVGSGTAA